MAVTEEEIKCAGKGASIIVILKYSKKTKLRIWITRRLIGLAVRMFGCEKIKENK